MRQATERQAQAQGHPQAPLDRSIHGHYRQGKESFGKQAQPEPRPDYLGQEIEGPFDDQAGRGGHLRQHLPLPVRAVQWSSDINSSHPADDSGTSNIQNDQDCSKKLCPTPVKTQSWTYYDHHCSSKSKKPPDSPISPRAATRIQTKDDGVWRYPRGFAEYSLEDDDSIGSPVFTDVASDDGTITTRSSAFSSAAGEKQHRRVNSPLRPTLHSRVKRPLPQAEQHLRSLKEKARDMEIRPDRLKEEIIWKDEREQQERLVMKIQQQRLKEKTIWKDKREQQERLARERGEEADSYENAGGRFDRAYYY